MNPRAMMSVVTKDDGRFLFKDVAPGAYRITVGADGYTQQDVAGFAGTGTLVNLTAGQTINDVRIPLTPTGSVEGQIREAGGDAVTGVPVYLWRYTYDEEGQRHMSVAGAVATDDRGRYRIFWIPPGRYFLAAGGPPGRAFSWTTELRAFTYFPSGSEPSAAEVVDIAPGAERTVSWTLPRFQLFRIRASLIISETGRPPASPTISLRVRPVPEADFLSMVRGKNPPRYDPATGILEIADLASGTYRIEVTDHEVSGGPRTTVTAIRIDDADVNGLVLDLIERDSDLQPIRGRVKTTDGATIPSIDGLTIVLRPHLGSAQITHPESDGMFEISLGHDKEDVDTVIIGDEYRVSVGGLPPGWYLREAKLAGTDALTTPVRIRGAADLELTLSPKAGLVEGVVNGADGKPAARATAVLIPDRFRDRTDLFAAATTDLNGRFNFRNVIPGDYAVYAWESVPEFAYFDPFFLEMFVGKGSPVHVDESSRQETTVALLPRETAR
jgi:protocatechuate 3,4-dioxygenase beta subunit